MRLTQRLIHNVFVGREHCLPRQRPIEFVLIAQLARPCPICANAHRIQVNVPAVVFVRSGTKPRPS